MSQSYTNIPHKETGDTLAADEFNEMVEMGNTNSRSGLVYGHIGVTAASPVEATTINFIDVDTWTFDVQVAGTYTILVTVEWQFNVTNADAIFRFDVNDAIGFEINQEPKDVTNNIFFTSFAMVDLDVGLNTVKLKARKEIAGDINKPVIINSNRFSAQKVDVLS